MNLIARHFFRVLLLVLLLPLNAFALDVIPGQKGFGTDTRAAYGAANDPVICIVNDLAVDDDYTALVASTRNGVDVLVGTLGECIYLPNDDGATVDGYVMPANSGKVILFETSGTIDGHAGGEYDWNEYNSYVSILGQTAPSPGITLRSIKLTSRGHDILFQHFRFRLGDEIKSGKESDVVWHANRDCISISDSGSDIYNVVIDHVSASWSMDENIEIWEDSNDIYDVTVSNSIVSEGLYESQRCDVDPAFDDHSKGLIIGTSGSRQQKTISILNNLFAHNAERNPVTLDGDAYIANNVIYNPKQDGCIDIAGRSATVSASSVGNVCIPGTNSVGYVDYATSLRNHLWAPWLNGGTGSEVYVDDNVCVECTGTPWDGVADAGLEGTVKVLSAPDTPDGFAPIAGSATKASVLANAGARPDDRDAIDTAVITEVTNESGGTLVDCVANCDGGDTDAGDWPALAENTDTHNNLPSSPHADDDSDGYTNLEEFIHDFAKIVEGDKVNAQNQSPGDNDTGVSITASATAYLSPLIDSVDIWVDTGACDGTPDGAADSDNDVDGTYDMSTLNYNTLYCLTYMTNYEGTTGDYTQSDFTTTTEQNPPTPAGSGIKFLKKSVAGRFLKLGAKIGR